MTLFAPDLFRNFALGFAAGGFIVGLATFGAWAPHVESPARAAAPLAAPAPDAEFLIAPILESE